MLVVVVTVGPTHFMEGLQLIAYGGVFQHLLGGDFVQFSFAFGRQCGCLNRQVEAGR